MLKFMDGFDHYATVGTKGTVLQKYLAANGYDVRNAADTTFSVVDGRRAGAMALRFSVTAGATVNPSLSWGFASTASLVVFGFALQAGGTRMRICRIENVIDVDWDTTTGKVKVTPINGQPLLGASPLIMNAWYYFEIEVDSASKEVRIWANDELQLTVPWTDTPPARYTIVWGQTSQTAVAGTQDIDDFYALDSSAGLRIGRLKPCEVATRMPSADVTTEWSIVNGTPGQTHASVAAQTLALETGKPYLQSNVNGQTDQFRSNATLPSNNAIYGVAVAALAKKGDVDNRSLGIKLVAGGQSTETQVPLTESYKYYQVTAEQAPDGTEWNQNKVESSEFGIVTR